MRRLFTVAAVALLSSVLTAAVLVVPALAEGDDPSAEKELPAITVAIGGERVEEFEKCMREHGFDFDAETRIQVTPDGVTIDGKAVDAAEFRAAQKECGPPFRHVDPADLPNPEAVPDELRQHLERARECVAAEEATA